MIRGDKDLVVVGDRILIKVDEAEDRTEVGLYLPPTALDREDVQSGLVEEVGPGFPLPPKFEGEEAPWSESAGEQMRYIPLQAKKGDRAIYMRKDGVEIKFDTEKYIVVPHSAILVLVRAI